MRLRDLIVGLWRTGEKLKINPQFANKAASQCGAEIGIAVTRREVEGEKWRDSALSWAGIGGSGHVRHRGAKR